MKKSIIAVLVLLVAIVLLPLIGNTLIQKSINTQLSALQRVGLEIQSDKRSQTYLHTSRHFEFVLKDSKDFVHYLTKYSKKQIPPYVNALLNGAVFGADVEYLNLPFTKSFKIDLYPLTLSPKIADSLRQKDMNFYNYIEKFLQAKGMLYHINYNLINSNFDGYVKDVDMNQTLSNGTKIALKLQKVTFSGKGVIIAPDRIKTKIKTLDINVGDDAKSVKLALSKFASSSNFASKSTYLTSVKLEALRMMINAKSEEANLSVTNFTLNGASNAQGKSIELESKSSIESLNFQNKTLKIKMKKLHSNIAINELNRVEFEKLRTLLRQNRVKNSIEQIDVIKASILHLLSQGLVLHIADFSIDKVGVNGAKDVDGLSVQSTITLKKDVNLAQKIQLSPLLALGSIDVTSKIAISKEFLALLLKNQALTQKIESYGTLRHNKLFYDISFIHGKMIMK